jgi:O-antigen/teichoic acid export membrane protein
VLKVLLKDSSFYFLGSLVFQLSGLVSVIIVMRALSVSDFGLYSYAVAFVTFFAFVADGGLSQYIVKKIAQNPDAAKEVYLDVQGTQILISALTLFALLGTAWWFNSRSEFFTMAVLGVGIVLNGYITPIFSTLIARGSRHLIMRKDMLSSLGRLIYVVAVSAVKPTVLMFAMTNFIVAMVALSYCVYIRASTDYRYLFSFYLHVSRMRMILREGAPFAFLMVANILYNRVDVVMLKYLSGAVQVGLYTGATQFIYPFMFISSALVTAIFPHLSRSIGAGQALGAVRRGAFILMGTAGLSLSVFLYFAAPYFFHAFFAAKFDASIPIFKILVWYLFIVFSYGTFSNIVVAKGHAFLLFKVTVAMLILNILLNFIFIPNYGASGAATVTLICETLLCLIIVRISIIK